MKQQQFDQWKEKQETTKIQINTGKHSTDSIQKTALLGTSHIIRKVSKTESWAFSFGDIRWV